VSYSYRIESIHIPATEGAPQEDDGKVKDFGGRRIVHVLNIRSDQGSPGGAHIGGMTLTVLTEQTI
jgi:hypothetical protein